MSQNRPAYFPFYPGDFISDEKVLAMDTTEVGAYILLLCAAWKSDDVGCLPDDDLVLSRMCRMSETKFKNRKKSIMSGFRLVGETYKQTRMIAEFEKIKNVSEKNSSNGKKGIKKRWENNKAHNPSFVGLKNSDRYESAIAKRYPNDNQSESESESYISSNEDITPNPFQGESVCVVKNYEASGGENTSSPSRSDKQPPRTSKRDQRKQEAIKAGREAAARVSVPDDWRDIPGLMDAWQAYVEARSTWDVDSNTEHAWKARMRIVSQHPPRGPDLLTVATASGKWQGLNWEYIGIKDIEEFKKNGVKNGNNARQLSFTGGGHIDRRTPGSTFDPNRDISDGF